MACGSRYISEIAHALFRTGLRFYEGIHFTCNLDFATRTTARFFGDDQNVGGSF